MNLHRQPQVMASMNSLNIFGAGKVASTWWKPGTSIRQKYQSRKAWKKHENLISKLWFDSTPQIVADGKYGQKNESKVLFEFLEIRVHRSLKIIRNL